MVLIIVGRFIQFFLSLAAMKTATSLLVPEEMGRLALVLATTGFFSLFMVNPVGMFLNRRLHTWYESGKVTGYFNQYWLYLLAVSVFAGCSVLYLAWLDVLGFKMSALWLIVLISGSIIFSTINQTVIPSLNMLGFSAWFVGLTNGTVALGFLSATVLAIYQHPTAEFWLSGILFGQIVFAGIGLKVLFKKCAEKAIQVTPVFLEKKKIFFLLNYTWPLAIAVGLGWIHTQSYRYLIEDELGLATLGVFVAGYGISLGLVAAFESIITTYFQPRFFRGVSEADEFSRNRAWHDYVAAVVPALFITVIFIIVLSSELTKLFLGPAFQNAGQYVALGALAEATRVGAATFSLLAHAHMRPKWLILPSLVGAVVAVVTIVIFLQLIGSAGAGVGLFLAGIAFLLTMYAMAKKKVNIQLPFRSMCVALFFGAALWGLKSVFTWLFEPTGMYGNLTLITCVVLFYLSFQYVLIWPHVNKKSND